MAKSFDQFVLRAYEPDDYQEYGSWWLPDKPPPLSSLPRIGLVVGDMKAVGFLTLTDCDFSVITFWRANPLNKARESHAAIKELMTGLTCASLSQGRRRVFCYTQNRGVTRILESIGFKNYDGHLIGDFSD